MVFSVTCTVPTSLTKITTTLEVSGPLFMNMSEFWKMVFEGQNLWKKNGGGGREGGG